jgi:hypothetical protein
MIFFFYFYLGLKTNASVPVKFLNFVKNRTTTDDEQSHHSELATGDGSIENSVEIPPGNDLSQPLASSTPLTTSSTPLPHRQHWRVMIKVYQGATDRTSDPAIRKLVEDESQIFLSKIEDIMVYDFDN